ncbi:type I-E CRISPR-associated protein Cas6/Cse3/CasE [Xanthobacter sp. V4C-4]|uniref:type I-E CRISPR-associated protein Cas6/Cse3/CasE n=1 Tax=Xanthobacter cornucopiae TaxID=3119924 RepID=UPI0037264CF3
MTLYLSRLTIARNPTVAAIRALIDPLPAPARGGLRDPGQGRIMDAHHRLIWSLFGDTSERARDFLWRSEGKGQFLVLSHRPPSADGAGLFSPPQTKAFAPDLREGDRLAFVLRANATRTRKDPTDPQKRGARVDLVMDTIHALPSGRACNARREARMSAAEDAGRRWLEQQGAKAGFILEHLIVDDYSVVPLPAQVGPRRGQTQFGVMDLAGQIRVGDPALLRAALAQGFGRAKAFGCGLMLIRRA